MKKILFINNSIKLFNLMTDSTYILMLEAENIGAVYSCYPENIYIKNSEPYCDTYILNIDKKDKKTISLGGKSSQLLTEFDLIFVRNDPPFNMEYYYMTQILSLVMDKVAIVNNPEVLRNYNEKLSILNFKTIADHVVTKNQDVLLEFLHQNDIVVVKPLDLMGGRNVFCIKKDDVNKDVILSAVTDNFSQTVIMQEYIPAITKGDKRIFIVENTVVKYVLCRMPSNNSIRSNLAVGGIGTVENITDDELKIANSVSEWMLKAGIFYAGIDVIGNYVNEINITSPTGMQQILRDTGFSIPKLMFDNISYIS